MKKSSNLWIRVTSEENIPVREGRSVHLRDREIAIFNLGDRFAAIDAACPHRGGPLCDGIVTGAGTPSLDCGPVVDHAVVCPLHGWKIDLQSGEVLRPEVSVRVDTYEVRVCEGVVEVSVPEGKQQREKAA
jgi:NAD(P)H-dependent nitrite reductase small subunit